jgi:hypothetical protein
VIVSHIYVDEHGESHFADLELPESVRSARYAIYRLDGGDQLAPDKHKAGCNGERLAPCSKKTIFANA